jgi:hypothetical protein
MLNASVNLPARGDQEALRERILASQVFRRSPRLSALLRYLAEHSLNDEHNLLSEQQVGIAVFGRHPGYNATEDSVVRVQVHNLRERLAEYFAGEGAWEAVVATIPKGKYCLIFAPRSDASTQESAAAADSRIAKHWSFPAWAALLVAVLTFALGIAGHSYWVKSGVSAVRVSPRAPELLPNPLLGSVLTAGNGTIVVVEDTMLVSASMLRGEPFSLPEFVAAGGRAPALTGVFSNETVQKRLESLIPVTRYVNLANVTFAVGLLRSYPHLSEKTLFRHPREVQFRDIRASNCILFGGQLSNPWIDLYEDNMNFHLRAFTAGTGFENRHPKPGEQKVYGDTERGDNLTYARISLLPNFEAATRALVLTGMGGPETEAAALFLLSPNLLEQLPAELREQLRTLPPQLEILLSASRVGTAVGRTQVVAWRVGQNP